MNQSYYYTLSTIAQSAATILALSGALVVFKISHILEAMSNYRGRVIDMIRRKQGKPGSAYYRYSNKAIVKLFNNVIKIDNIGNFSHIKDSFSFFEHIDINDNNLVKSWAREMHNLLRDNIKLYFQAMAMFIISAVLLTAVLILSIYYLAFIGPGQYSYYYVVRYLLGAIIVSISLLLWILCLRPVK